MLAKTRKETKICGEDVQCKLISTYIDEGQEMRYTTYGIRLIDRNNKHLLEFPDISTDQSYVESFIALCNEHQVHLVHVRDVLEDYLI